jgi:hypothetical protein
MHRSATRVHLAKAGYLCTELFPPEKPAWDRDFAVERKFRSRRKANGDVRLTDCAEPAGDGREGIPEACSDQLVVNFGWA